MLKVTHLMLERYFPKESEYEKLRFNCHDLLYKLYQELHDWKPETSGREVARLGRQHCILYAMLSRRALVQDANTVLWHIYPKHHMFLHCVEDQVLLTDNPRDIWNYGDESEIGSAVLLAETGHPRTLHREIIDKYRVMDVPGF